MSPTIHFLVLLACVTYSQSCSSLPPNFPQNIPLTVANYQNWAHQRTVQNVWMATPFTPADVVTLANWAKTYNYKLRASGFQHTWAPLTVTNKASQCGNTILVNTITNLTRMAMIIGQSQSFVRVQTGAKMETLLGFLEANGYGFYNVPAVGKITVGGALTINGHGTSVPAKGETLPSGFTFGSLSNTIVSLTAVVWDPVGNSSYVLKTFDRTDTESSPFLVHLGRTFVVEVTMMVGKNYNLRCVSRTNVSADELFANSTTGSTVTSFLDQKGRLDVTWFPYTKKPWLKIISLQPKKPLLAKRVTAPYNYPLQNIIPPTVSDIAAQIINGNWSLAPAFGKAMYLATDLGLLSSASFDLWGASKNIMLYVADSTLLMADNGYVIQTSRTNVQKIFNKFYTFYTTLVDNYTRQCKFPTNGPINIRFNSLDRPMNATWVAPAISALNPISNNSSFDIGIWLNFLTFPNTPDNGAFMTEVESFLFSNFNNHESAVRVEWPKGWAFTANGAWSNLTVINNMIPSSFQTEWNLVVSTLNKYDPYRIFTNDFIDLLMKK